MMNTKSLSASLLALSLMFASCATDIKKANISASANPQTEMAKLESDLGNAQSNNIDVLASGDYNKSLKMLKKAKADMADKEDQQTILNSLSYSRAYYERAMSKAETRKTQVAPLLDARQAAIKAGAAKYPQLKDDLKDVDEDIISDATELNKLKTEEISEMITEYVSLERRATVLAQIGTYQAIVNGAMKDNAEKKAPQTLKKAQIDLKNAETIISTNVRNPTGFKTAVMQSEKSTALLVDVMKTINENGKNLPEATALVLVKQNKRISGLTKDLNSSKDAIAGAESALESKENELKNKESEIASANEELASAQETVAIQAAINSARKMFPASEAEAYQQGGKLLIRLKSMNFKVGKSDLPEGSLAILAKVSEVAKSLNATEITVEGHTDSTGPEQLNLDLSKKRAEAVATYFKTSGLDKADIESEGYGFARPIASNKVADGRAQNRRVDIIIEPMASANSKTDDSKSVE